MQTVSCSLHKHRSYTNQAIITYTLACVLSAYILSHLHKVWASAFFVRNITLITPESARLLVHGTSKLCSTCFIPSTSQRSAISEMPNLFKRARPSLAPDVVYPSRLADLYQGHALWYPESHNTGEPQIGDVGYMSGGSFIRLFSLNSSLKPEQQVTFWPTPFTPAQLDPGVFEQLDKREALRPDHYLSHGVYRRKLSGAANV